ncbi:MAG: flagellar M-ring protein FliF [Lachnospiraceae bacterium]|nr:flagellar M-ring protein FliF [Lachnospiraceae bacterium]
MQTLKENWQNLPEKTQKIIKVIAAGTLVITLIAVLALNLTKNKDYSTLFTGLSQEEAQQVVSLLQDSGIDYRYNSSNGAIRVPEASADQTRANLLSQGYPKNGFAYDMYLDHTGLMTTESDKKQITLYDLQDRLGATIRLFEGVRDAKVTIVEATDKQYVLGDSSGNAASASVVVTMNTGSTLTAEKAQAVKNLISHSVRGMNFTTVSVFDSATMLEVGGDSGSTAGGASDLTSLTTLVESNIAANVRRVLEQLYGTGNVAVSVKGKLNMERLIQESTQYTTPDKINETDKTGLLQTEDLTNEDSLAADQSAGGLVGADANADTPRYTNEDGTEQVNEGYSNSTASRVWLYNMLKEQRQIDPGVLEDTSIGVVIISDDNSVDIEDLLRLVANSAGVPVDTVNEKVTIIRSPGPEEEVVPPPVVPVSGVVAFVTSIPLPVLIAIGAGAVLLLLLLLLLMIRSRRRKRAAELLAGDEFIDGDQMPGEGLVMNEDGELVADEDGEGVVSAPGLKEIDDEFSKNEEILNLRMQRSLRLKQNIGDFVDQNPQIAAKLVQSWLRGEEGSEDGRNSHAAGRKQPK